MSLPYDYYPAVLYAIESVGQGRTLTSACELANISIPVFKQYVNRDAQLQAMYDEAVQCGNDALVDALIDIDNHMIHGHSDPKMAKVKSDNIKWVLSKRDTARFGDRIEVKHEIRMDQTIVAALEQARSRVTVIDAEYTVSPALPLADEDEDEDEAIMREILG